MSRFVDDIRRRGSAAYAVQLCADQRARGTGWEPPPAFPAAGGAVAGRPQVVFAFAVTAGTVVGIQLLADQSRLDELELTILDG